MNPQNDTGQHIDPRWAIAYDKLNRRVMSNNEWGLANPPKTVDFEKMGELGNNLGGFFGGLAEALSVFDIHLAASAFLILPYSNRSDSEGKMGAVYYWQSGTESAKRMEGEFDSDEDTLGSAFGRVFELAPDPGIQTVGLAYLVKALHAPANKAEFNVDEAVAFAQIEIADVGEARAAMNDYLQDDFVQRFVFLLRYRLSDGAQDVLLKDRAQLMHLFGGNLSAIGVASEEVNNQLATELGMNLGIKAHQIGNALYGLNLSLNSIIEKLNDQESQDLREELTRLEERSSEVQQAASQFEQANTTVREIPWTLWYPILNGRITGTAASYNIVWESDGVLPNTRSTEIRFSGDYFRILVANLVENAQREHAKYCPGQPLVIRLSAQHENGELVLRVGNSGPPIPDAVRAQLFRAPVVGGGGNNGRGLWMLGLAFTNSGSPLPSVRNEIDFGPVFEFRFRAKRKIV